MAIGIEVGVSLSSYIQIYGMTYKNDLPIEEQSKRFKDMVGEAVLDQILICVDQGMPVEFTVFRSYVDEGLGFSGLVREGLTAQEARDKIAEELPDYAIAALHTLMTGDRRGELLMQALEEDWRKKRGVEPPWAGRL